MFTNQDIAEYYNTTQNHYERWWKLKKNLSVHYGIWDKNTKNFSEALINTNRVLMEHAKISEKDRVLDAGCGVGGAAFFLNQEKGTKVVSISLSEKQINFANTIAKDRKLDECLSFEIMDYTKTSFPDASFNVIWACESICHTTNKHEFFNEAYRLLKKGGKLICAEYFLADKNQVDKKFLIKKWLETWSIESILSLEQFQQELENNNFKSIHSFDYTKQIYRSAKRMYWASMLGALFSITYNLLNPKVSRFAKTHYKSGYYQFKALKKGLWKYGIVLAIKK